MAAELTRRQEGVVTQLTLNRPHKANALCSDLVEAIIETLQTAYEDGTRLLTIEGSGSVFCAGFDFTDFEESSAGDLLLRFVRIETMLQMVFHAPFATLALAHGRNFGAGADLVCACSRRVITPGTTFRMPGLQFGIVLGTRRLAARVGDVVARALLEASATFEAEHACRVGFATQIAERDVWPDIVAEAGQSAAVLSAEAAALLYSRTVRDTRNADMADLAVSAAATGLKERIGRFRGSRAGEPGLARCNASVLIGKHCL